MHGILWPDNTRRLKRLHAARRNQQSELTVGNWASAWMPGVVKDIEVVGRSNVEVELTFSLNGYFRNNGEEFYAYVKAPRIALPIQP